MKSQLGGRNPVIDILKGICIIMVIINHLPLEGKQQLHYLFPFWVFMAVPVFMIISGYVYSISFEKRHINSFNEAYKYQYIVKNIIRYTIPFLIAYIFQIMFQIILGTVDMKEINRNTIIRDFFTGDSIVGGYYYPIMIQFIFIFPIIYFVIKKNDKYGLLQCLIANLAYEIIKVPYGIENKTYRLLIFRYIFLIAFGCWFYLKQNEEISIKITLICLGLGVISILFFVYTDYKPKIFIFWTRTNILIAFYAIAIFILSLKLIVCRIKILEVIGRASYHIFLVQGVYYYTGASQFYDTIENKIIVLIINILICTVAGVIFYYLETPITRYITDKIRYRSSRQCLL